MYTRWYCASLGIYENPLTRHNVGLTFLRANVHMINCPQCDVSTPSHGFDTWSLGAPPARVRNQCMHKEIDNPIMSWNF